MSDDLRNGLRVPIALGATGLAWWLVHRLTTRNEQQCRELETTRQLLSVAVVLVGIVAVVLPVDPPGPVVHLDRGQRPRRPQSASRTTSAR